MTEDRLVFLERKNKELKLELKKKDERIQELDVVVKYLKRNGEQNG